MGFGINLRFGLRRLSDDHLAMMLETAWRRHDAAKAIAAPRTPDYSWRGPIRHPLAYPFISVISDNQGLFFLDHWGFAFSYSVGGLISLRCRAIMNMHLALCDIADIMDELQRRTSRKNAV